MDMNNGKILKKIELSEKVSHPIVLINDGKAIFANTNGHIAIIDISKREILNEGYIIKPSNKYLKNISIYKDKLICTSTSIIEVYVVDIKTLDVIWSYNPDIGHTSTNAFCDNGKIYIKGGKNNLVVLDINTGEVLNDFYVKIASPEVQDKNYIYTGLLEKIDKENAEKQHVIYEKNSSLYDVILDGDYICYYSNSLTKANKENGVFLWNTYFEGYAIRHIGIAKKYIIIKLEDEKIFIIDKETGDKLFKFQLAEGNTQLYPPPVLGYENYGIIFSYDGKIYCFDLSN